MTDRNYVLRWAHLGLGRNPRYRHVIEEQHRIAEAHIAEIQAEQEALDAARHWPDGPPLRIVDRYVAGRPRRKGGRRWR